MEKAGNNRIAISMLTAFVLATLTSNGALWARMADIDVDASYSRLVPQMEQVLTDHGTEFAHLRDDIQQLRGETLILTKDRFTGRDWAAQRRIMDLELQQLQKDVALCKQLLGTER